MASNSDFNSRLSQLKAFEKSQDYSNIVNTLTEDFDSDTNDIIKKWISNETLSNDEKNILIYIQMFNYLLSNIVFLIRI